MSTRCNKLPRGPRGSNGRPGSKPTKKQPGKKGAFGTVEFKKSQDSDFFSGLTLSFIKMCHQEAENNYLNNKREEAAYQLLWLQRALESEASFSQETVDTLIPGDVPSNTQVKKALLQRVRVQLMQLSQGLDYYGHYPNYVPLTSLKVYEEAIDSMIPLADDIEDSHREFSDKNRDDKQKALSIKHAASSLELKKSQLKDQSSQLSDEANITAHQIKQLSIEKQSLDGRLRSAQASFISAVQNQASCDFGDVLTAAAAVASIASGVGAIVGGVAALGSAKGMIDASNSLKEWKETGQYLAKHFEVVGGGLSSISEGYEVIKGYLEGNSDAAKLIVAESDFEAEIEPYLDLPEARQYLKLMRAFLCVVKIRNSKIIELDSKYTRMLEIESELSSLELEIRNTKGRLIEVFNPRLAEHVIFFEKAVSRTKADLIRSIIMAHKALSYWSLKDDLLPDNLHVRSLDYIKNHHRSFKQKLVDAIDERNMAPLKFEPPPINFNRDDHPDHFTSFDDNGRFTFSIDSDESILLYTARVLVNSATLKIALSEERNNLTWIFLQHHGDPTFIDRFGKQHAFSHRRRESRQTLMPGANEAILELGGGEKYAFLSPIATWTLILEFAGDDGSPLSGDAEKLARKTIRALEISFKGVADSRYTEEGMSI
jgi:hypothetical protein